MFTTLEAIERLFFGKPVYLLMKDGYRYPVKAIKQIRSTSPEHNGSTQVSFGYTGDCQGETMKTKVPFLSKDFYDKIN